MPKLALAVVVIAAGGFLLLARERADAPLADDAPEASRPERSRPEERRREAAPLKRARCPSGVAGCRSVIGRIVYVEAVDPDGDGDLHVVVADGGISLPGLTAVDVRPGLRPRRDPHVGDRATAAGPVQTGSYGQSQIHALRFAVQR
jgi:hypothetical protein